MPEDQQPEDQQSTDQQPTDQQPTDQQPTDQQPTDQQPIEVPATTEVQTVILSDEQFSQLNSQIATTIENQVWLIGLLTFLIAGVVIQAFFDGWRSSK